MEFREKPSAEKSVDLNVERCAAAVIVINRRGELCGTERVNSIYFNKLLPVDNDEAEKNKSQHVHTPGLRRHYAVTGCFILDATAVISENVKKKPTVEFF